MDRGEYPEALKTCSEAIAIDPENSELLRKRSHVHAMMKQWHKAIEDIATVIGISDSPEPDDYFSRGRWSIEVGLIDQAIADLTEVISFEATRSLKYYSETAYFYRSYAYLMAGRRVDALNDCKMIRQDFAAPSKGQMRSRMDIEQMAAQKHRGDRDA